MYNYTEYVILPFNIKKFQKHIIHYNYLLYYLLKIVLQTMEYNIKIICIKISFEKVKSINYMVNCNIFNLALNTTN